MMKSLLWKDFRLNRLIVIMAVALAILPYPWMATLTFGREWRLWQSLSMWRSVLQNAGMMSLGVSILSGTLFAGNALACERAARSSEFLAYLPPPRWRILLSKTVIATGVLAVLAVANIIVVTMLTPMLAEGSVDSHYLRETMTGQVLIFSSIAILFFGFAWLGSALLESPAIATCLGIAGGLVVVTALITVRNSLDWPPAHMVEIWFRAICMGTGAAAFVAGCLAYLYRADP